MKKIIINLFLLSAFAILLNLSFTLQDVKVVQGMKLQDYEYSEYINVNGEFSSEGVIDIILAYPVYIKEVFVSVNTYVSQGQALFSIDKEKMQEIIDTSYLDLSLQTLQMDFDINSLPDIVYAESEGIVVSLNSSKGALMMPNVSLCKISPLSEIVARFTVTQTDFGKIEVGDIVNISSVAFSDIEYSGVINDTTAIIHEETSALGSKIMVDVFADIKNPDMKIADGLQITAKIQSGESEDIKIISYEYINQDSSGEFVYILKGDKAHKQYITTGKEAPYGCEILDDIEADTIFLKGDIENLDTVVISNEE